MPRNATTNNRIILILLGLSCMSVVLHILVKPKIPMVSFDDKLSLQSPFSSPKAQGPTTVQKPKPVPPKPKVTWSDDPKGFQALLSKTTWTELYSDDFNRSTLGDNYELIPDSGLTSWHLIGGKLRIADSSGGNKLFICTAEDFSGDLKMTYECRSLPCKAVSTDLSACFGLTEKDRSPLASILYRFGSFENTLSGIGIVGMDKVTITNDIVLKTNVPYTVTAIRLGKYIHMEVNGHVVASGYPKPELKYPTGKDAPRQHIAFYAYRGIMEFDNLHIYRGTVQK